MGHSFLYNIVDTVFWIYTIMLVVSILSSWFTNLQDHPIICFTRHYTDPYLHVFRKVIPPLGMMDISPIVAFFALGFIESMVKGLVGR